VDIVDPAAMPEVRAANARPRLVTRSAPVLERIMQRLDAQAARHGSGRAVSWHVDLPANAVVVTVADDARHRGRSAGSDALPASDALLAVARAFGDAVRIHRLRGATTTQAGLRGGQGIEADDGEMCTGGFTATDRAGRPVLLTAGHCGKNASWFSRNGSVVGRVRAARFPGDDFAVVALDNIAQWTAQPSVERYGPSPLRVRGHSKAVVGSTVCKSGRRTGWTCGRVVAHDVTVSYDDGAIVSGLTQTSACSRRGDSGGPLMAGRYAQGMLSGGQTIGDRCLDRYGMQNVSVFQPVGEALSRYGLRLLTSH